MIYNEISHEHYFTIMKTKRKPELSFEYIFTLLSGKNVVHWTMISSQQSESYVSNFSSSWCQKLRATD